jgi:hypothetical protein
MEWFSDEESVVKPEALAPKDMGFLRLGVVVFVKRVYDWMRAAVLGDVVLEREGVLWVLSVSSLLETVSQYSILILVLRPPCP